MHAKFLVALIAVALSGCAVMICKPIDVEVQTTDNVDVGATIEAMNRGD